MMITTKIRQAMYASLSRYSGAVVEEGRVRRFEKEDFYDEDSGQKHARVVINTLNNTAGDTGQALTMDSDQGDNGCCVTNIACTTTIMIALPIDDASETELEAVEAEIWPLLSTVELPDNLSSDLVLRSIQPAQIQDSCPIAALTIQFQILYGFDMSKPAIGHRLI